MVPVAILAEKSGLVHRPIPGQQPSRNYPKLIRPMCPSRAMMAWGTDAAVTCQRCLNVRWGADKLSGGARRMRVTRKDVQTRKLGRLKKVEMAPEYGDLIAALERRLIVGYLFNDPAGTSLDIRMPTHDLRRHGVKVWHPLHARPASRWIVQCGDIWNGAVAEHVFDLEDIDAIVSMVEAYIDSLKQ